jgi:uncharacterized PurR-regulated membrane protein YhhQ (DUF165 family)
MVFTVQSGLFFLAGLAALIIPAQFFASLGISLSAGGIGLTRIYGVTVIMAGVIAWMAREAGPSPARRAIVLGFFVGNILAALVGIFNILTGTFGSLMWVSVIVWALMALDFGVINFKYEPKG